MNNTLNILLIVNLTIMVYTYLYMICRLREVAKATTESQFQKSVDALKCSTLWKNKLKLQQWFDRVWLAHYKVSMNMLNYHTQFIAE